MLFANQQPPAPADIVIAVAFLAAIVVMIAGLWRIFSKAGEPGWSCLIPFYNVIALGKIAGLSGMMIFLMFLPIVGIIPSFILHMKLAARFGKDDGFGLLMALFPFIGYPILGFGSAKYERIMNAREAQIYKGPAPDFSNLGG